jgi:four helix bundle protein
LKAKNEKNWNISDRSFDYALRAIKLFQYLQGARNPAGWVLSKQYLRSGTSIGANIEEAQSAESRADFIHKYGIARKEAKESLYWLRLLSASGIVRLDKIAGLIKETEELIAIISSIILTAKRNKSRI